MGSDRHSNVVRSTLASPTDICLYPGTYANTVRRLNFSDPTILNLDNTTFNPEYAVIPENYTAGYVFLVITSQNLTNPPNKNPVKAAHPIHLHGHDFVILAQSTAPYNVSTSIDSFNFNNPPRRDVALLPLGGYLAIAFRPDNPGLWLVHCHIGKTSSGFHLAQPSLRTPSAMKKHRCKVSG